MFVVLQGLDRVLAIARVVHWKHALASWHISGFNIWKCHAQCDLTHLNEARLQI